MLFVRPARLAPYVAQLARRLARHRVAAVCGPLVGGAFVAQAVATELAVEATWSQRQDGAYALPAGVLPFLRGRRVAVVDDAVNAGSAVLSTAAALTAAGAEVCAVGTLLALGDAVEALPAALGVPVEHLAALPTTLWPVADCPLCRTGAPVDPAPSAP